MWHVPDMGKSPLSSIAHEGSQPQVSKDRGNGGNKQQGEPHRGFQYSRFQIPSKRMRFATLCRFLNY